MQDRTLFTLLTATLMAMGVAKTKTAAQALPITIDGVPNEWQDAYAYDDATGEAPGLDLTGLRLANDGDYLYLRLSAIQEFQLTNNSKLLFIFDTDNDPLTGAAVNGLGAELVIDAGEREAVFYGSGFPFPIGLNQIGWRHLPVFSSEVFEIALPRFAKPDGTHELLPGPELRMLVKVGTGGDQIPEAGQSMVYAFDDSSQPPAPQTELPRNQPHNLRLMTWNTLQNGLDDLNRKIHFQRVIKALQPDVVTFNECWDLTAPMIATFMNSALPLGGANSWFAVKIDAGNITASRYPFIAHWEVKPNSRLTASLIDLPATYATDLLAVNAHLRCCDADNLRQAEADAFAAFMRDAKSPGGVIDLPHGTPVTLSGDMNLVGFRQQLHTLLQGDIVNTAQYGSGGPPDWDDSPLEDALPLHTHRRMAYTWRNDFSSFPPSRLDYVLFTNSTMTLDKTFVLHTDELPQSMLDEFNLQAQDTRTASDHAPVITDFILPLSTAVGTGIDPAEAMAWPNPFRTHLFIRFANTEPASVHVFDPLGRTQLRQSFPPGDLQLNTGQWPVGWYIIRVLTGNQLYQFQVLRQ